MYFFKKIGIKDQLIFGIWLQIDKIIPCDVFFFVCLMSSHSTKMYKKSVTFTVEKEETTYE